MTKTPSQSDFQRINLADLNCINDDKDALERGFDAIRKSFGVVKDWILLSELANQSPVSCGESAKQ
jgi:hypothetical protein